MAMAILRMHTVDCFDALPIFRHTRPPVRQFVSHPPPHPPLLLRRCRRYRYYVCLMIPLTHHRLPSHPRPLHSSSHPLLSHHTSHQLTPSSPPNTYTHPTDSGPSLISTNTNFLPCLASLTQRKIRHYSPPSARQSPIHPP